MIKIEINKQKFLNDVKENPKTLIQPAIGLSLVVLAIGMLIGGRIVSLSL